MKTLKDLSSDEYELYLERCNEIKGKVINKPYEVLLYSANGMRYFRASRKCVGSDKLNKAFGGGSYWLVSYGQVEYTIKRDCCGGNDPILVLGKTFSKSKNGTEIYRRLESKKEVIELAKQIGIFNI